MAKRRPRRESKARLLRSAESLGRVIGTLQRQLEATQRAMQMEPTRRSGRKRKATRVRTRKTRSTR